MDWNSLRCNGSHPYGCCTLALCCKLLSLIIKLQVDDVIQFMTHNLEPQHDEYVPCLDTYIYNWTINNFQPKRSLEVTDKCSRMGQEKMHRKRRRITEFNLFILITQCFINTTKCSRTLNTAVYVHVFSFPRFQSKITARMISMMTLSLLGIKVENRTVCSMYILLEKCQEQ